MTRSFVLCTTPAGPLPRLLSVAAQALQAEIAASDPLGTISRTLADLCAANDAARPGRVSVSVSASTAERRPGAATAVHPAGAGRPGSGDLGEGRVTVGGMQAQSGDAPQAGWHRGQR